MNYAQLEYAEGIRNLLSINPDPILEGSWTPLQIAKDYAEVGEDCGLTLDEAVEIIERELEQYMEVQAEAKVEAARKLEALNATAKEQAKKLLWVYKWTPIQRRKLEQQQKNGYIVATHGQIAKIFGRKVPNNADEVAVYRIGWLGDRISKRSLNFTC